MRTWLHYLTPVARARDIDPVLVAALIAVESAGNPWAVRYEKGYKWLYEPQRFVAQYNRSHGLTLDTETMQQRTSHGLLQVMGAVARERGCDYPFLSLLTQPAINLEFGLAHLAWLRESFGYTTPDDLAAAWNGGRARRYNSGPKKGCYTNYVYVDKCLAAMQRLREEQG